MGYLGLFNSWRVYFLPKNFVKSKFHYNFEPKFRKAQRGCAEMPTEAAGIAGRR